MSLFQLERNFTSFSVTKNVTARSPFPSLPSPTPVLQTERNVTVILLSEIVWELLRPATGCLEPLPLFFPDYSIGNTRHLFWAVCGY